jgi:Ca2+-binding EF-hand superfamily protein
MLFLLSVFHIQTEIDQKYRYLFRLYDIDKDFKLGINDLMGIF